ncbi:hypothetical protein BCF74_11849 [Knoellia remsis]|uniref:Uncharacterized protein n=1 Tax=Knoellia remsis TaxID=407159 RepID=A0A2T0UFK1_9MICO|nr:hypothetical protein BCF74_11849 [Knoellia remsis]
MWGYVVALSARWVVLQSLEAAVYIDGYDVIRVDDITEVWEDGAAGYIERAVAALGRPAPDVALSQTAGTADVLQVARDAADLMCVHFEKDDDAPMLVGHLVRLDETTFDLQLIDPGGVWEVDVAQIACTEVTRVEFGDRYSVALTRFGDRRPEPEGARALDSFCTDEVD